MTRACFVKTAARAALLPGVLLARGAWADAPAPQNGTYDHYYGPSRSEDDPVSRLPSTRRDRLDWTLPYDGKSIPPGDYRVERTWQSHLLVPSATVLGLTYFSSYSAAVASEYKRPDGFLVIPFAGPFLAAAGRVPSIPGAKSLSVSAPCFSCLSKDEAITVTVLLVDGLAQLVSGTLLVVSIASPKFALVKRRGDTVSLTPVSVPGGYGLGVRGVYW